MPFLREYLPQTNENVAMLFTMCSNDVAKALMNPASSAEVQATLHLEVPNLVEAGGLLLAELEAPNEEDTASKVVKAETLVKSVGCLPLAINQLASFVKQHSKNLDYLLSLYQSQRQMDIMSWDNQLSMHEQRSVMTTFSSTLDELAKDSPVANLLLQTLSFFDPESIASDMIVDGTYPISDLRAYSEERKPKLSEPLILTRGLMQKLQTQSISPIKQGFDESCGTVGPFNPHNQPTGSEQKRLVGPKGFRTAERSCRVPQGHKTAPADGLCISSL